jgi:aspartate dehydrogenase
VSYTGSKPPRAWIGTPAETLAQSAQAADIPVDVFEGTAREAALRFPQNANVAATVALAGVGFEETRVRLVADPQLRVNQHAVQADGTFGRFELTLCGNAQSTQPKTSVLVAFSLARYLTHRQSVLSFA